eukprot:130664_1
MFSIFGLLVTASVVSSMQAPVRCHLRGPFRCNCIMDQSFIVKQPSTGHNNTYLLILDIDLTIIDSVLKPAVIKNKWQDNWIRLDNNSWGSIRCEYEILILEWTNASYYNALIRKNFFKTMKFVVENKFTIALYTRGNYKYAKQIYHGLNGLFKHWLNLEFNETIKTENIFDLVIASNGQGKSLELVHNIIDLETFKHVLVVDDDYYFVWCHQFLQDKFSLFKDTSITLISPRKFAFLQHFVTAKTSDARRELMQTYYKDRFFELFEDYLKLIKSDCGQNICELMDWLWLNAIPQIYPGYDHQNETNTWWTFKNT